ncbi:hypothetical protein RhiJN_23023 [Ceratobasidium sp. AG-Ba]|nr:hypothetical protein RhiJN_23023 [Ceratobasidium sp. AG-Ba]
MSLARWLPFRPTDAPRTPARVWHGPLLLVQATEWNAKVAKAAEQLGSPQESFKRYPITKIQGKIDGMMRLDEQARKFKAPAMDELLEGGGLPMMSTTKAV